MGADDLPDEVGGLSGGSVERFDEARSLVSKGRPEEALAAYAHLVEEFVGSADDELRVLLDWAVLNKAALETRLGRVDEALRDYRELLARPATDVGGVADERRARALYGLGVALADSGAVSDALMVYDELVERFDDAERACIRAQVVAALNERGRLLLAAGQVADAMDSLARAIDEFGEDSDPETSSGVAYARVNRAAELWEVGDLEKAMTDYDEVIATADPEDTDFREPLAIALGHRAAWLHQHALHEEALEIYDLLIERFADAPETKVQEHVAWALVYKGVSLAAVGRLDDALDAHDEAITKLEAAHDERRRKPLLWALLHKAAQLDRAGRTRDAVAAHDSIQAMFRQEADGEMRELVDRAAARRSYLAGSR